MPDNWKFRFAAATTINVAFFLAIEKVEPKYPTVGLLRFAPLVYGMYLLYNE